MNLFVITANRVPYIIYNGESIMPRMLINVLQGLAQNKIKSHISAKLRRPMWYPTQETQYYYYAVKRVVYIGYDI